MRLELAAIMQKENEAKRKMEDFLFRLRAKAKSTIVQLLGRRQGQADNLPDNQRSEVGRGKKKIKRKRLFTNLKLEAAIKIALACQAT